MTAAIFIDWRQSQLTSERFELLDGDVGAMSAERAIHTRAKATMYRLLSDGIAAADLACKAFMDGLAVRVEDANIFEPDALVRRAPRLPDDATVVVDPIIVVEVACPSKQRVDALIKFARYFRNPHISHYVIVVPADRIIIHHRREGAPIESASLEAGTLVLDPPNLEIAVSALFPARTDG